MRVTDLTKQNAVVRNMQNNSAELQNLQETMASGRRINRLSDDPLGATQAQDHRTKISYFQNLKGIIEQSYLWLDRSETELESIGDHLMHVKTLILSQANDTADEASRQVTAEELRNIMEQMVQSGNARVGKVYVFGGSRTLTPPLEWNTSTHPGVVRFAGEEGLLGGPDVSQFRAEFQGFSQNPYVVRITNPGPLGRAHYRVSDDGGQTWSRELTLLPDIEVVNDTGKPSDKVLMSLPRELTDDQGMPVVYPKGLEMVFRTNPPLNYTGNDDKRVIPTSEGILKPINVTARDIFFQRPEDQDSLNVLGLMMSLETALLENDRETLSKRVDEVDQAFEQVLNLRADLGAVRRELDTQADKVTDREFNSTKQMSDLEDLDFPKAVLEMNTADTRNKATLDASSRLIRPSLLNFLR